MIRPGDALNRPRVRKALGIACGVVALWALVGFLVLPRLLRPVVERKLAERLHRPVSLSRLSLNPFTLSATLGGLEVRERGGSGPFFSFESLYLNLEAASIFRGGPVLRAITLTKPAVTLVRFPNGTYNVQDLLDGEAARTSPTEPGKKEAPLRFSLNNIRVEGGRLDFDDRPNGTKHEVRGVRIGIPFLSNIPSKVEITTQPAFEATVNGAPFALHGKTKPFSETRETALDLDIDDLDLPFYLAYVPRDLPSRLTSGRLDTRLTITFRQPSGALPALVLSGSVALRRVMVEYGGRPILAWDRFEADLDAVDVFGRKARLRSLKLFAPELWVRRESMGEHNVVLALVAPARATPRRAQEGVAGPPGPAGPPPLVEIAGLGVESGRVHYDDFAFHPPFQTVFTDFALSVKDFSTAPGRPASFESSWRTEAGEGFRNAGTVSMTPLTVEGAFSVEGIALKRYTTFVDEFLPVEIDSGLLGLKTRYRFTTGSDRNTTLSGLAIDLKSPALRKKGEKVSFFRAASVSIADTGLDLARHELVLGEVRSAGADFRFVREKDGSTDLASLLPKPAPDAPPPPPSAPWYVALGKADLEGTTVRIEDRSPSRAAQYAITRASLRLEDLSTAEGSRGTLSVRFGVDGRGSAAAKGRVGFHPMFADLRIDVKGIDLVPLEAYVLQNLRLSLAGGEVSADARLSISEDASGRASVVVSGNALVANVLAVDEATKQDVLKWESFSAEGMKAGFNPIFFGAAKLALSGVTCDVTIEADGAVNLRKVVGAPAPPDEDDEKPAPAPEAPPEGASAGSKTAVLPVRIDALTLQGGTIRLTDRFIRPNYAATLGELGGRVTGLSSADGTVAELDLRGKLAGRSPLQISGALNPLAATAFADVKASFRDIDLPAFTPYAGKYAGYGIASGTLTVEVAYRLENRKLNAQNRIVADQFSFGEKVESRDATKLPVKLAVSLLKDKDGVIDLDLPIDGSIDDPKFRIGKVIWKVLGNLIAKAATAPFALLGRLLGGKGEDFSSVDFADGRDVLDEAAKKKLDALGKALRDRPGLKLEATGRFSEDADREGLRRNLFERKLKAQKLPDLVKRGEAPGSVDDVVVGESEWADTLKKAYKKEKFPKPRTALGFTKELSAPEMEKLMLANLPVTGDDLRRLALDRANAVKGYLAGPAQVDPARVFVLEPGEKPAVPKDKARASRVDFSLK